MGILMPILFRNIGKAVNSVFSYGRVGMFGTDISVAFDLKALWTAGDQTFIDAQVLDKVGKGVEMGNLTVVETDTGTVEITGGKLIATGSGGLNKTGVVETNGSTRALGKTGFLTFEDATNAISYFGFNPVATIGSSPDLAFQFISLEIRMRLGAGSLKLGTWTVDTTYETAVVLGGYDTNGISFKTGDTVGDFTFGGRLFIKGGDFTNWTLLWAEPTDNTATEYYMLQKQSANPGQYDNILILTSVLDVDIMFQPNFLDIFTGVNDDQLVSNHTPEVVAGVAGSGNPWESGGTTWTIQGNEASNNPGVSNTYTSNFSVDEDGFLNAQGIAALDGNIDAIGGEDDTLRLTVDGVNINHFAQKPVGEIGKIYRIRGQYYVPSSNSHGDGFIGSLNEGSTWFIDSTTDAWISWDVKGIVRSLARRWNFFLADGGITSWQDPGADDVLYLKDIIIDEILLNEIFASDDMGITQGIFDVDVTIAATTDGLAGLVLCLDSVAAPANFVEVFYNRLNGKVELWKIVAGTYTSLINTTATYSAGATLRVIMDYISATDDLKIKVYYNGALIGTEQTIEDNGIAGNTRHGIMSVDSSNSLDNFTVHKRTDPNWDTEISAKTGSIY